MQTTFTGGTSASATLSEGLSLDSHRSLVGSPTDLIFDGNDGVKVNKFHDHIESIVIGR